MSQPVHGTVVSRRDPEGWRGVLLCGPSGAGKSDLAMRLIDRGWWLVADDYAHVWVSGGVLHAAPSGRIAGRMEARGVGIVSLGWRPVSRVVLQIDCVQQSTERMPDPAFVEVCGVLLPRLELDIRPASATVTVGHAMDRL